jgi:hypothetical protein
MYSQLSRISSEIYVFNIWYLSSEDYVYISKDVRIVGYFSKPKGSASKKVWDTLPQRIYVQEQRKFVSEIQITERRTDIRGTILILCAVISVFIHCVIVFAVISVGGF